MNTLIVGKDANGTNRPVAVDADGKLLLAAEFTGTVSVGEVSIDHSTPGTTDAVVVSSSALPTGAATQTTLAALLAKVIAAPATEAAQNTGNGSLAAIASGMATETTLADILAKLIAAPATEATLAALEAKVTAVNTGAVVVASGALVANSPAMTLASAMSAASLVVKAAAGTLFSLTGFNAGPAQFLQLHDAAALPANGAVPILVVAVPAVSSFAFEWKNGLPCASGIVVCNSDIAVTKRIGSADCHFTATRI
ncbi:MAG: hypothetical protein WCS65_15700 [Verrucomicrobiae bacterium]